LASTATTPAARFGGGVGSWLRYPVAQGLSLQAEVSYELRGVKTTQHERLGWEGALGSYTRHDQTRFHYLSVPLLVRG
jgi:hypothetical protein